MRQTTNTCCGSGGDLRAPAARLLIDPILPVLALLAISAITVATIVLIVTTVAAGFAHGRTSSGDVTDPWSGFSSRAATWHDDVLLHPGDASSADGIAEAGPALSLECHNGPALRSFARSTR
jgi:hypothetical protein